jgi:hypothetical protein
VPRRQFPRPHDLAWAQPRVPRRPPRVLVLVQGELTPRTATPAATHALHNTPMHRRSGTRAALAYPASASPVHGVRGHRAYGRRRGRLLIASARESTRASAVCGSGSHRLQSCRRRDREVRDYPVSPAGGATGCERMA